jgi:hypothetical protein
MSVLLLDSGIQGGTAGFLLSLVDKAPDIVPESLS